MGYVILSQQGCDKFTQNFLSKLGVRTKSSEKFPEDPFTTYRSQVIHRYNCLFDLQYVTIATGYNATLKAIRAN